MPAFATFLTICVTAVLFLFRFLYALHAETKAARSSEPAGVESVSLYRSQAEGRNRDSAPALTLIHFHTSRLAVHADQISPISFVHREKNSQYKEA